MRTQQVERFLREYGKDIVDCRDDDQSTALHLIASTNHTSGARIVRMLAKHGADLNAKNSEGWQPLHYAATNGNVAVMETLLECGADVDGRTPNLLTALALCCTKGSEAGVRTLIKHRAKYGVCGWRDERGIQTRALTGVLCGYQHVCA